VLITFDKATCFLCAFKHDDTLKTCNSKSTISVDLIFYLRAGVCFFLVIDGKKLTPWRLGGFGDLVRQPKIAVF